MWTALPSNARRARLRLAFATATAMVALTATLMPPSLAFAQQSPTLRIIPTPQAQPEAGARRAATAPRAFQRDSLIVQFAPGVDPIEIINRFIMEDSGIPGARVQVKVLSSASNLAVVSVRAGGDPEPTAGLNTMIEGATGERALASTRAMQILRGVDGVVEVSRDYVLRIDSDLINSIINDGEGKQENGAAPPPSQGVQEPPVQQQPSQPPQNQQPPQQNQGSTQPTQPSQPPQAQGGRVYPNDEGYRLQWHLKDFDAANGERTSPGGVNFPTRWARTTGNAQTIIAVVDSGIVASHEDIGFASRILPGYDFVSAETEVADDGTPGRDSDPTEPQPSKLKAECGLADAGWHGTHVAGIAGATESNNGAGIAGGAWNVRIMPVRVLNKCGEARLSDALTGILWAAGVAVEGAPTNPNPAHIINLSLGAPAPNGCDSFTQAVIDAATSRGIVVVVAAGNEAVDVATRIPGSCRGVITVAAGDARGHLTRYSNFGARVDILAPGGATNVDSNGDGHPDGVLSTVDGGFQFLQGTSMAAPLVSAAVALVKAERPDMSPEQIRDHLKATARPRTSEHCPQACGAGLLDLTGPQ